MDNGHKLDNKDLRIPINIVIGVTGHRKLPNQKIIHEKTNQIIKRLKNRFENILEDSNYSFSVLSPLAEGADSYSSGSIIKFRKIFK